MVFFILITLMIGVQNLRIVEFHSNQNSLSLHLNTLFFFAKAVFDKKIQENVILKFRFSNNKICKFTETHGNEVYDNYRRLGYYLSEFDSSKNPIYLNCVFILENEDVGHVWCELELENFKKFHDFPENESQIYNLTNSLSTRLTDLQIFIFNKSKGKHIIVDMQGSYNEKKKIVYLTDIEFSDTLEKFGYKNEDFLKIFLQQQQLLNTTTTTFKSQYCQACKTGCISGRCCCYKNGERCNKNCGCTHCEN